MDHFLLSVSVVMAIVVLIGFFNEKVTHLTDEIALLLFSTIIGLIITVIWALSENMSIREFLDRMQFFNLERFLMDGVLCFMLFAGARNLKISSFRINARSVSVLAFVCTLLSALLYGFIFYGVSKLIGLGFSLPMCLMMGSIIAPTDPIAATSILKKFGLAHDVGFLMEAESLLNDGVGVALFVVFSGMVSTGEGGGFLITMGREIFGAVAIGAAVSFLCYLMLVHTKDQSRMVFITLLAVALSYYLCELLSCSGAIACVVTGLGFSIARDRLPEETELATFDSFWDTTDVLLNSVLYVIMGLSLVRILQMPYVGVMSLITIVLNFVCRYISIWTGSFLIKPIPGGYTRPGFSMLFTWGGLRGGLCIALAMSTAPLVDGDIYHIILGCIYAAVFFTTVVQGLTMRSVHERLKKA